MTRTFTALFGLTLGVGLLLPAGAGAQASSTFLDTIDVRLVNLEAAVTDRAGNRIQGLAPDDFRLFVDGEEVPIGFFTEVRHGRAVAPATAPGSTTSPPLAAGQAVGTSFLVFVDDYFPIRHDRDAVLDALAAQIPLVGAEDRMAIVAWDGKSLEMLTSWTSDPAVLDRAVATARARPAYGLERILEMNNLGTERALRAAATPSEIVFRSRLTASERFYAERIAGQVERATRAAAATLRGFASPPGRKVMLLLSGGWPFMPARIVVDEPERTFAYGPDFDSGEDLMEPIVDVANRLGYTLYPVDVPRPSDPFGGAELARLPDRQRGLTSSFVVDQERHDSLRHLAHETGGEALLNAKSKDALGLVREDLDSYYWLGFTPPSAYDDTRHDIRLEVGDRRMRVRTRQSYLDASRRSEIAMAVESTLLFGQGPATGALSIQLGEPRKSGWGRIEVPVTIAIPADAIALLPGPDGYHAALELVVAAKDENQGSVTVPGLPIELSVHDDPSGRYIRYETTIELRRLDHEVTFGLWDPVGGNLLASTVALAL